MKTDGELEHGFQLTASPVPYEARKGSRGRSMPRRFYGESKDVQRPTRCDSLSLILAVEDYGIHRSILAVAGNVRETRARVSARRCRVAFEARAEPGPAPAMGRGSFRSSGIGTNPADFETSH